MLRCYVTDRRRTDVVAAAARAARAGVDLIQVREKGLAARELLDLVSRVLAAVRETRAKVLVNDRLDVALAAGADGVHLPSYGLPLSRVRPLVALAGVSVHTLEEARAAEAAGADFVIFGPIFPTPGKTPVGLDPLREVCRGVRLPVLAIGGMTPENAAQATAAGAAGIAGIRLFQDEKCEMNSEP